jgi:hypothetical protein
MRFDQNIIKIIINEFDDKRIGIVDSIGIDATHSVKHSLAIMMISYLIQSSICY